MILSGGKPDPPEDLPGFWTSVVVDPSERLRGPILTSSLKDRFLLALLDFGVVGSSLSPLEDDDDDVFLF